jgi:hypothetical protein
MRAFLKYLLVSSYLAVSINASSPAPAAITPSSSTTSSTLSKEKEQEQILVQEIATVSIQGDKKDSGPLSSILDNLEEKEVFISIRYGDQPPSRSINLAKSTTWNTNTLLEGLVNGHFQIQPDCNEELICELKVQNTSPFGALKDLPFIRIVDKLVSVILLRTSTREKVIATATFAPDQISSPAGKSTIKAQFKFKKSTTRAVHIELGLIRQDWHELFSTAPLKPHDPSNVEPFFSLTGKFFVKTMDNNNNAKAWELKKNEDAADPNLKMDTPLPKELPDLTFPKQDEFVPVPLVVRIGFALLGKFPFKDSVTNYRNRAHAVWGVRQKIGKHIPEPKEGRWPNPARDPSMKRIYFSSIGSFFVKKAEGFHNGYVADITDIAKYPVRENDHKYLRYGAKTFFDEKGNIKKIEDIDGTAYYPGDEDWEWAKMTSRTAAFTKAAFIHLGEAHYCWGNFGGVALRMFLPPDHPIRRAFSPHFYKTHHTCVRAEKSLFAEEGLLSRSLSLKYEDGLKKVFQDYITGFEFTRFPDDIKSQGVENCPFHVGATDGVDLHQIFCNYASELFDETYNDQNALEQDEGMKKMHKYLADKFNVPPELKPYTIENIKIIWGEILFRVTGFHNAIGAVTSFALDPAMLNVRRQEKEIGEENGTHLVASEESASGVAFISAITQVPCPTIGQCWKQVLADPDAKSYANLRKALDKLEETIEIRNEVRYRNVDYSPRHCAISISS